MGKIKKIQKKTNQKTKELGLPSLSFHRVEKVGKLEEEAQFLPLKLKRIRKRYLEEGKVELAEQAKILKIYEKAFALFYLAEKGQTNLTFEEESKYRDGTVEPAGWQIQHSFELMGNEIELTDKVKAKFEKLIVKLGFGQDLQQILVNKELTEEQEHSEMEKLLNKVYEKVKQETELLKEDLVARIQAVITEVNNQLTTKKPTKF